MQYLILHKVRGEPQLDIAEPVMIGAEEGWVLCTCGHRAYPYKTWPIETYQSHYAIDGAHFGPIPEIPDYWPDHYTPIKEKPPDMKAFFASISKFVRRI